MNLLKPWVRIFDAWTDHREGRVFYPVLLLVLIGCGMFPLLYPGIPQGHDYNFHFGRLYGMAEGVRNGLFPVFINHSAMNGLGYGTGLFYPDIFLYPIAVLAALGMNLVTAYKIFIFFWAMFTAGSMYWAAKRVSGSPKIGFIAGILYGWSSYFAVDLFNRFALGEALAFPFIPMILLGAYELLYGDSRRFAPMVFGFAGLVLTHNITTILMTILLAAWFLCGIGRLLKEPERILRTLLAGGIAFLMSLFYFAAIMEQLLHTRFYLTASSIQQSIAERAVPITRLFLEVPYMKMEYWIPSGIGIIFLIVLLQRLRFRSSFGKEDYFRDALLIGGVCSLVAATNALPWEGMMRVLAGIQFPWRFYLPATAFLALGGALTLGRLIGNRQNLWRRWFFILFCFCGFAWSFNVVYVYAAKIKEHKILKNYRLEGKSVVSGFHYLPFVLDYNKVSVWNTDRFAATAPLKGCVKRSFANGVSFAFSGNCSENAVELPLVCYYGYHATTEDGTVLPVKMSANGLVELNIPAKMSAGTVAVRYSGTFLQKLTQAISLFTLIFFSLFCLLAARREKQISRLA